MRLFPTAAFAATLAATFALSALPAAAQVTYSGNTTGGPTWNRPRFGEPPAELATSINEQAISYSVSSFTPTQSGVHGFLSRSLGGWDNTLYLYEGTFDPTSQLTNILVGQDDIAGFEQSGFTWNLTAGATYQVVTSGYSNSQFGAFENTIDFLPGTFSLNGDTTGGATWNRPNIGNPPTELSLFRGTNTPYQAIPFVVETTGNYFFRLESDWDAFTLLYEGAFDPSLPLNNALISTDDLFDETNSGFFRTLTAGTTYTFVATGRNDDDFGAFTTSINGPGAINPVAVAVPEPATLALLLLTAPAFAMRRRRRRA